MNNMTTKKVSIINIRLIKENIIPIRAETVFDFLYDLFPNINPKIDRIKLHMKNTGKNLEKESPYLLYAKIPDNNKIIAINPKK